MKFKFSAPLIALMFFSVQIAVADTYILDASNTPLESPIIADDGETNAIVSSGSSTTKVNGTMTVIGDSTINNTNRLELHAAITADYPYTITKIGGGQLLFMNDSSAVGKIVITAGQVVAQNNVNSLNAINGVDLNAGSLQIWALQNVTGHIYANGGTFQSAGGNNSFIGDITQTAEMSIDVTGSYEFTTTGTIGGPNESSVYRINKTNTGTWNIQGPVNCGYFDMAGGTVKVQAGGNVQGTQLVLRQANTTATDTFTFTVDGGTATFTGDDHRLGHWPNHIGVVNVNSGSFRADNTLTVGWDGTGKLYQTGGTAQFGTIATRGTNSLIEFSGGTTTIGTLKIGQRGDESQGAAGSVTFKGNSDVSLTYLYAYHGGTLNIQDNAKVTVSDQAYFVQANNSCTFTIEQTGGTFTVNGNLALGHYYYSNVTYNISGGTLNVPNYSSDGQTGFWLAVDSDGTLNQSGGTINTGRLNLNARDARQLGTYVMTGGTLNVGTGGIMATRTEDGRYVIQLQKGTITAGASSLTANKGDWSSNLNMELAGTGTDRVTFKPEDGYSITLSGVLSGSGGLIKDGAGTLTLSGNNTFSGGIIIKEGTLAASNPSSLGEGPVTLNGGKLDTTSTNSAADLSNELVVGANGGTLSVYNDGYTSFSSISGSGDLTTSGNAYFKGTGGYSGHLTVNSDNTRIDTGAVGVIDLTLNGSSQFRVLNGGTTQFGNINSGSGARLRADTSDADYTFEIGAGTKSEDTASFAGVIHGVSGKKHLTLKKVGDGTQTLCRGGYVYAGVGDSLKEVIIDQGKLIVNAEHADLKASNPTGFFGSAPITINSGGTLVYDRSWNSSHNVRLTLNGGTLTLNKSQYFNKMTFKSGTINGGGQLRVGFTGAGAWTVSSGTTTIETKIVTVKKDSYKTFTINIADGATLDIKNTIYGLADSDSYKGTNFVASGSGNNGTGKIIFNPATCSAFTDMGTFSFSKVNIELTASTKEFAKGLFNGSAVTLTSSTMTSKSDHATDGTKFTLDRSSMIFDGAVSSYIDRVYLKNGSKIEGASEDSCFRTGHQWDSKFYTQYDSGNENLMNEISANIVMYDPDKTMTFDIADYAPLTISGSFIPADPDEASSNHSNAFVKTGAGDLTLTGQNSFSTTTISAGKLIVSGNGTLGTGAVSVEQGAELEFYVDDYDAKQTPVISGLGTVHKYGAGTLRIDNDDYDVSVKSGEIVAHEGHLNVKGVYDGVMTIDAPAIFSPGNSVGTFKTDVFNLSSGATLLLEQDASGMDMLTANTLNIEDGAIMEFVLGDIQPGATYEIISDPNGLSGQYADPNFWMGLLSPDNPSLLNLIVSGNSVYLAYGSAGSGVPEPSTWALLILGAAGLLYWRKRK